MPVFLRKQKSFFYLTYTHFGPSCLVPQGQNAFDYWVSLAPMKQIPEIPADF